MSVDLAVTLFYARSSGHSTLTLLAPNGRRCARTRVAHARDGARAATQRAPVSHIVPACASVCEGQIGHFLYEVTLGTSILTTGVQLCAIIAPIHLGGPPWFLGGSGGFGRPFRGADV